MGVFCSDPGQRPGHNLRFAGDSLDDTETSDEWPPAEVKPCGFVARKSSPANKKRGLPSVKKVPLSSKHLRVYQSEKKWQECSFDLDSVNEADLLAEKALSDITYHAYWHNPSMGARLTEANLSMRDSKEVWKNSVNMVSLQKARWNDRKARSVCSDRVVHYGTYWCGDREEIFSQQCPRCSSREPISNESYAKSDSESDSLKYPRTQTRDSESLSDEVLFMGRSTQVNKQKAISPGTSETDRSSLPKSCRSAPFGYRTYVRDDKKRSDGHYIYPETNESRAKVEYSQFKIYKNVRQEGTIRPSDQYIADAGELSARPIERVTNTEEDGLIFNTLGVEDILYKDWPETDCKTRRSEVTLP